MKHIESIQDKIRKIALACCPFAYVVTDALHIKAFICDWI